MSDLRISDATVSVLCCGAIMVSRVCGQTGDARSNGTALVPFPAEAEWTSENTVKESHSGWPVLKIAEAENAGVALANFKLPR